MRVLFLVWSSYPSDRIYADPSVFYRCFHPAEALRRRGMHTSVMHFSTVDPEELSDYDRIIFFRPQFSDKFLELHSTARQLGLPCVASYDDLFFDIEMLRQSNFRGLAVNQHKILASRPYNYAQAMYFFDRFISSTDPLADRIRAALGAAEVHVQYNAVSDEMLYLARMCTETIDREPLRLGYFAGGASHAPDLMAIAPYIAPALAEAGAEFFCVETVEVPDVIAKACKVTTTRRMSYAEMIRAYATCCVTIAPLHMNPFTISKSGIKYLEASLVGAATVATPIPDIMRIADDRLIPVETEEGWYDGVRQALALPHGEAITRHQQERIRARFSTSVEAERLVKFLETVGS